MLDCETARLEAPAEAGPDGWAGRLAAGAALAGVAIVWLAVLPIATVAFAGAHLVSALSGRERLRRKGRRG